MAKSNDLFDGIEKVDSPAPLTVDTLLKMLIKSQEEAAEANKKLGEAILESRKPYVDPKVLEQKAKDLEERRRMIALEAAQKVATKRLCPHTRENGTPNIKWHQHSNNIILGVCGRCFSQFDARNQEDLELLRRDLKSMKNMGRAGAHAARNVIIDF